MNTLSIVLALYSAATTAWIAFQYLRGRTTAVATSLDMKIIGHLAARGPSTPLNIAHGLTGFKCHDSKVTQAIARCIARGEANRLESGCIELSELAESLTIGKP